MEGFKQMKIDLESEKKSMHRICKKCEKQIEKVIINTIDMYGSVKAQGLGENEVEYDILNSN